MVPSFVHLNASASAPPSREGSGLVQVPLKRPRPVLSCVECRRKKLKCDRLLPCKQCEKAGSSAQCTYNSRPERLSQAQLTDESEPESGRRGRKTARAESTAEPHERGNSSRLPAHTPRVTEEKIGVIEDLQYRVNKLERLLSDQSRLLTSTQKHANNHVEQADRPSPSSLGVLSIKGSRSRYHGQNHKITLLYQFDEAKNFIQKSSSDPSMTAIMKEFQLSQKALTSKHRPVSHRPLLDDSSALSKMLEMLPPRLICDKLVGIYFNNHEKTLRILHVPTFLGRYEQFWDTRENQAATFTDFIPQLTTVLAIAHSLDDSSDLTGEMSEGRLSATTYCGLVEAWLGGLNGKRRIELSTLRTQSLLLLARQSSLTRVEEMWHATGALVRSAMTMGLHRDPTESPNISIFQREQRRRLWMTIVEMDLQTSLTCGMPTMVRGADFNCCSPANVDDLDLFEVMTEYPVSRPLNEWSDSLSQVTLARSLPQRLEAISLVSNINLEVDYWEVLKHGRKLEESLQDLPAILKSDYVSKEGNEGPGRLFTRILLDTYIRRALLCLYRPFTLNALGEGTFPEARRACVRSSLIILSHQDAFDPNVADLDVVNSKKYWDLFHVICKNDIMQAALSVCLEIEMLSLPVSSPSAETIPTKARPHPNDLVNPTVKNSTWTKASLTRTIEDTLDSLLRRITEFGSDLKDPLCLAVVLQSVRTQSSQEKKDALMREGATSVIKACQQHFLHEDRSAGYNTNQSSNVDMHSLTPSTSGIRMRENGDPAYPTESQNAAPFDSLDLVSTPSFASSYLSVSGKSMSGKICLPDADIDFGEADFGFAIDWDLDRSWL
ncbi:MAG: hypothetical protein M1830_001314 [Pleopsidium flavum]|nr:MAG: hypothetical protein M1830_001314 [Pleopsidium flavum]